MLQVRVTGIGRQAGRQVGRSFKIFSDDLKVEK
jgi:hypothetical protein